MGSVCARVKAQYRVRERELGACTCIARATESARVVASASDEHEGAHTGQGRSQRIDLRLPCVSTCLKLQAEATPLGRHAARAATIREKQKNIPIRGNFCSREVRQMSHNSGKCHKIFFALRARQMSKRIFENVGKGQVCIRRWAPM